MSSRDTGRHDSVTGSYGDDPAPLPDPPPAIGRYRVVRRLGAGGFGVVYLAQDEQLGRPVAIKVPHAKRLANPAEAELYLREARTVAALDHPHIVPVYDAGSTPDCPFFVVSKYIDGSSLADRLRAAGRYSSGEAAALVATVADCLHYAHQRGLVHRDIKPGNILIDQSGKPYLADFGLALLEQDAGKGGGYVGTPAYMSPEQARGEGHRVDGRSDIFSLGIVLYELVAGHRPVQGPAGELLAVQAATADPTSRRRVTDAVPKELERICLRAMAKRAANRYPTAREFADDLRLFLATVTAETRTAPPPGPDPARGHAPPTLTHDQTPPQSPFPATPPVHIIPRGLRAFDEQDADFFLDLLPGPRDRTGLPESIRFWKARIEGPSPDAPFPVGLIYGASGCGKSSLVKAGLLPRLSDRVVPVYVEAAPGDTERRLVRGLRARSLLPPGDPTLPDAIAALRRGSAGPAGKKVLIVLDQFEQWLHGWTDPAADLVQALRQCDGERVQCLVLVRDDFYVAVHRFFQHLEVPIREGGNYALVDLFDADHARKVLKAFGRAYGKLPDPPDRPPAAEEAFLTQAVDGLAQNGKVISVRLALFAEMMKGRPWTPASLRAVGGTEGVGVTFLEETFSSGAAPPTHRVHQVAARAVLRALLPEAGTDIRGQMQSAAALRAVSGYADRPADFRTLVSILESEVRLIAPTDPGGQPGPDDAESTGTHYQLTHDFLVPAVREWLTRKQRETPGGRAQLLLAERAALWAAKPEVKQLPTGLEWLTIVWRTDRSQWTDAQRRMMRAATRRHTGRVMGGVAVLVAVALLAFGVQAQWARQQQRDQAERLVDQLLVADLTRVDAVAAQLAPLPGPWRERLERLAGDDAHDPGERLRAHLALVRTDPASVPFLVGRLLRAGPAEVAAILQAVGPQAAACRDALWPAATGGSPDQRLRAAAALAALAPADGRWGDVAAPTAAALVRENPLVAPEWARLLRPVRTRLLEPLATEFAAPGAGPAERTLTASLLADYAADRPDLLARVLQEAGDAEFPILFPAVRAHAGRCADAFQAVLAKAAPAAGADVQIRTRRRANAAMALFLLGRPDAVRTWLGQSEDPDLRTALIDRLPAQVPFDALWPLRLPPSTDLTRQAVLIAADGYRANGTLTPDQRARLEAEMADTFARDDSPGVHAAAEWLLRSFGKTAEIEALTERLARAARPNAAQANWWVTPTGHTFALVRGPVEFQIGSPPDEVRRDKDLEDRRPRRIPHSYAIATHEVTVAQFRRFFPDHKFADDVIQSPDCPANKISWYDAARFCRRLSEEEKVPPEEMVYPPVDEIRSDRDLVLPADWQRRTGYRLPTEAEWEYANRAGTQTARFFGTTSDALNRYGWWLGNSDELVWPVGSLRPNPWGLFDTLGNVGEWCHDRRLWYAHEPGEEGDTVPLVQATPYRTFRGGYWQTPAKNLRSAKRDWADPDKGFSYHGFRVVRTVRPGAP